MKLPMLCTTHEPLKVDVVRCPTLEIGVDIDPRWLKFHDAFEDVRFDPCTQLFHRGLSTVVMEEP